MYAVADCDVDNVHDVLERADSEMTEVMLGQLAEPNRQELLRDDPTWARLVEQIDKLHIFVVFDGVDFSWTMAVTDSTSDSCRWSRIHGHPMISIDWTVLLTASTGRIMKVRGRRP